MDDLKQGGCAGITDAAQRFDASMGTRLLTYATPAIETAEVTAPPKVLLCPSR